jgi:hypothetical protein
VVVRADAHHVITSVTPTKKQNMPSAAFTVR